MVSRESPFLPSHARGTTPRTNRIRSTTGRGREDGVRQHLLGARAGHRRHRSCAHHERSLQLAVRRHRGGCALAHRVRPHRHRGRHHQRHVHPRGRHRRRCPGHWAYTLHRRQRGHFRVPRDLGHFGGAHQCDGGVGGVRHVGSEEREKPHRRGNSHVRAGRAHLRGRLLQLPDRRIGHAPRHRRAAGVAREAVVPHRRHSSADMHDRARVFVGGSGVRRRRRPGRRRHPAVHQRHPVQLLLAAHARVRRGHRRHGLRLRPHGEKRARGAARGQARVARQRQAG